VSITKIVTGAGGVKYTPASAATTATLKSRTPTRTPTEARTIDVWGGSEAAINELYAELSTNSMCRGLSPNRNGASSTLTVTWNVDFVGDFATPQEAGILDETADKWTITPLEIPTALASHPYFQTAYVPASGEIIEDGIAEADDAIANSETGYENAGAYSEEVNRYYALRMAGVEEFPQIGVEIRRTFETTEQPDLEDIMQTVGLVVAADQAGFPVGIRAALEAIPRIDSYNSPGTPTEPEFSVSSFEWLHKMPSIELVRVQGVDDRYTVTDVWWGAWSWSSVLYPGDKNNKVLVPGGTWDPPKAR
jgi:hypothetical protein